MKLKVISVLTLLMLSLTLGLKPVRAGSGVETVLYVDPLLSSAMPGETFTVDIKIADVVDLFCWQVVMSFNPNVLQAINIIIGDFLAAQPGGTFQPPPQLNNTHGWAGFGEISLGQGPASTGVNGSGWLATVEFHVVGTGESVLNITDPVPLTPTVDATCKLLDSSWLPKKIPYTPENGYFNSNVYWVELLNLYNQLLDSYNQLLASHNTLWANYSSLLANYYSLNSSYYSLLNEYQDLLNEYDDLESDHTSLNATYTSLHDNYIQLQTHYDSLQSQYDDLSNSYSQLETDYNLLQNSYYSLETTYNLLNSTYDSLKADYDDLKSKYETSTSELGTTRNLSYILILTTTVFAVTTAYFALRKPKVTPT